MSSVGPLPGLSLMPSPDFREAVAPLFDDGQVAVVEWTIDVGWAPHHVPAWAERILAFYAEANRLYAHGFALSPLSGEWRPRQDAWLESLRGEVAKRRYRHVSEHFCFSFGGDFDGAGPLPVPMTERTIALGRARLAELSRVAGLPIGLENLATSFGRRDALEQGPFLEALLAPVDGFVVLDLHNLYCQCENFGLSPDELFSTYPADRVREIHISGGSWDPTEIAPSGPPVRRDTHDGEVPPPVFDMLDRALSRFRNVEAVFLERLAGTLGQPGDGKAFRADYARMKAIVDARRGGGLS
jgi:uncharacterized protein